MLKYIIWIISFVSLWLIIVWLNFIFSEKKEKKLVNGAEPKITFAVPAFNEEKTILKTVNSLLDLDYPSDKIEVVVVNDGSTDNTEGIVKDFIANKKNVFLVSKENGGKASAINSALDVASGDFFAVVDADSFVERDSVNFILPHFENDKVGAVISRIKIDEPKNFLEKIQYFEYIMSSMIRKIMTNFKTLSMTPGVLSVYRTSVLKSVGGFVKDKNNLTEDLEIALRLKSEGFDIVMEPKAVTYTKAPDCFKKLWHQRIRWSRGYIYNHWNYRNLFFSKKQGIFGMFQLPINVLIILLLVINASIITYEVSNSLFQFVFRSVTIKNYFITTLTAWPTLKEFVLARNIQVNIPIFITTVLAVYLIIFAIRYFKESVKKNYLRAISYMLVVPYFTAVNWIASIFKELRRSKRKW